MIDYLELFRREENDALWDAVRRLSEPLFETKMGSGRQKGAALEHPAGEGGAAALSDQMARQNLLRDRVEWLGRESEKRVAEGWTKNERMRSGPGGGKSPGRAAEAGGQSPDRAAEAGGTNGQPGRTREASWEMTQAEQLDRVFRRDSRRYDGGFFLY